MKLLFLDCDGVINGTDWCAKHSLESSDKRCQMGFYIDPVCMARIERIVKATGCKIVWSSSWRHSGETMSRGFIKRLWSWLGFSEEWLYSWTPWLHLKRGRAIEIMSWLDEHTEVEGRVLVIDDARFKLEYDYRTGLEVKVLMTSNETGITEEDTEVAISWLNSKS